ncbi:xanthine dehydrogenase family protein subunit M [Bradyrhizobium sp. KBS0727]|uniref:FAD binding domain-containing protein n=1 Tax=unclassified Bradyrhizobium TaxID=2631580 RepID=UPI00110D4A1A|nr:MULTISPECIES: xanthine dehydrogenase family protein subunit M [unclassified Bradyrhizobium]QDW39969.1 xanthine dehydrogenase family protein subunit M [Bradyrhizobium sp. KBS0725]QDW46572.1 xanthine dehydrogenase family protein subunit M [Bradyrhizobium sp. KBS0727]
MKASAFAYARATSVENALELLADQGDRAKVLSGGQSLMPAMNLRLISPELVVDIGGLAELRGIAVKEGILTIGALTRYVDLLKSTEIAAHAPLLADAVTHVAHPAIRNRGTIGGSLAHADPASELPACMVALAATIVVRGPGGERRIAAREFFTGIYETALSPQELLVAVDLPVAPRQSSHFFHEFARRHGDYAIVGLAAQAVINDGRFADLRLGFFAVGDRPLLAGAAGKLVNVAVTSSVLSEALSALADELDPQEDHQATPAMRRHLAKVLLARSVSELLSRPELHAGAFV